MVQNQKEYIICSSTFILFSQAIPYNGKRLSTYDKLIPYIGGLCSLQQKTNAKRVSKPVIKYQNVSTEKKRKTTDFKYSPTSKYHPGREEQTVEDFDHKKIMIRCYAPSFPTIWKVLSWLPLKQTRTKKKKKTSRTRLHCPLIMLCDISLRHCWACVIQRLQEIGDLQWWFE